MPKKRRSNAGRVYLVGAGPGDPGLLTLKGKAALEKADSVVYDFLANPSLLRFAPQQCEKLCVGKRAGHPTLSQERINRLLIQKARAGRLVVRLKGGDPFVFGRGGEEALALARAGVPFEVVPGVTSGYAAPAYAGIPVTHRGLASSVTFVTAHEGRGAPPALDWKKLAAAQTLVLFMGTRKLGQIAQSLIRHGRPPGTPAAVIEWGSRARQRVVDGTLSNIAARSRGIAPPALIIVGGVVSLRRLIGWFEKMPLSGRRIVVTRARDQAGELTRQLEELGAEVLELPVIEIRNPATWKKLDAAIRKLESFDDLLFTSANGVRKFLERMAAAGRDARALAGLRIGAIGPGTASALSGAGIRADFLPGEFRAEGLLQALAGRNVRGKSFLIPRARVARDLLPASLRRRGARVTVVEAYRTAIPRLTAGERRNFLNFAPDAITFTSSSTFTHFLRLFPSRRQSEAVRAALFSIGPITTATIRAAGFRVAAEARDSTVPGLVSAIRDFYSRRRKKF